MKPLKMTKIAMVTLSLAIGLVLLSIEWVIAYHHLYLTHPGGLTLIELAIGAGSFAQILAAIGAIPLLFWKRELILSRRSWSIYCLSMIVILVRRSFSIYSLMGYERMLIFEMSVAIALSLSYLLFQASVFYDTLRWWTFTVTRKENTE